MGVSVIIAGPSLDSTVNVSGISSVIRTLIGSVDESDVRYTHFVVGSRDGEPKRFVWLFRQFVLPYRAFKEMRKCEADILHLNTPLNLPAMVRDFSILAVAKLTGRKVLLHLHGGRYLERSPGWSVRRLVRLLFTMADKVIVLSPNEKQLVTELYGLRDADYICNAIRVPCDDKADSDNEGSGLSCIFLGRIVESKGIAEIVETFRQVDDGISLKIFGAGDMQDYLLSSLSDVLGNRFYYGGVVAGKDKFEELKKADVLILPSRHGEGLPIVLLEAMACEVPIIASGIGSIPWAVRHDVDGLIIRPYSSSDLLAALRVVRDPDVRSRLRASAKERYKKYFSPDTQAKEFVAQYFALTSAS